MLLRSLSPSDMVRSRIASPLPALSAKLAAIALAKSESSLLFIDDDDDDDDDDDALAKNP